MARPTSTVQAFASPSAVGNDQFASHNVVTREFRHGSTRIQLDYRFDRSERLLTVTFSPVSDGTLSPETIERLLYDVRTTVDSTLPSYETDSIRILTSAMSPDAAAPMFDVGFRIRSELTLLTKELSRSPLQRLRVRSGRRANPGWILPPNVTIRRGSDADLTEAVDIDQNAFGELWAMDHHDLRAALTATPSAELIVAHRHRETVGFAIVGRSGRRGYLQRLAVHTSTQGLGVGSGLVNATCDWAARGDVRRLVVNTQTSNGQALRLYRRNGFVESPLGLVLLDYELSRQLRS